MTAADVDLPAPASDLQDQLVDWYEIHKRSFPWRETTDPFAILVMEVMSQQTQLSRVEEAWTAFLDRWPDIHSLAATRVDVVIAFWSSHRLGYNRRARYLHEAAVQIVEAWDGEIPEDPASLEELPGVGPYTANAVASFAFNAGGAVVDTNVKRVVHRLLAMDTADEPPTHGAVADVLLPPGRSRTWNNAIMELGATVCTADPNCEECPWQDSCRAYDTGDFRAPDVPTQAAFAGSRRQYRGRIVRALTSGEPVALDTLGRTVRVDYDPAGEFGRDWLCGVVNDLADDGLVELEENDVGTTIVRLASSGYDS